MDMELPNRARAYVPVSKLLDYLLSEKHPVGRAKARFLREAGFDETNVELLEHGLLEIAQSGQVLEAQSSPYGTKYIVQGTIHAPQGERITLQTIWIIEVGQNRPRFVTAYPI